MWLEFGDNSQDVIQSTDKKVDSSNSAKFKSPTDKLTDISLMSDIDDALTVINEEYEKDKVIKLIMESFNASEYIQAAELINEWECENFSEVNECIPDIKGILIERNKIKEGKVTEQKVNTKKEEINTKKEEIKNDEELRSSLKEKKLAETTEKKKEVLQILIDSWINHPDLINEMKAWNFDKVIEILKSKEWILETIALELSTKNPKKFLEFRQKLESIDSSFVARFNSIEPWLLFETSNFAENSALLEWSVITSKTNSMVVSEKWDTTVEYTKDSRKISVKWSEYKLDAKIKVNPEQQKRDFEAKVKSDNKEINEELSTLSIVIEAVNKAILLNTDIDDFKNELKIWNPKIYNELWLDSVEDLNSIKNILVLHKSKKQEEKDKNLKRAKEELQSLIKSNADKAKEVDEKKVTILRFIKNSWLWIIPQDKIDQIIAEFKWWLTSIKWLKLKRDNLDISNWMFWEETSESWKDWFWDVAKENIKMFMEKMLYWEVWSENSIFKWIDFTKNFTIDPTKMIWECSKWKNALYDWINWNITAMKDNLAK